MPADSVRLWTFVGPNGTTACCSVTDEGSGVVLRVVYGTGHDPQVVERFQTRTAAIIRALSVAECLRLQQWNECESVRRAEIATLSQP